MSYAHVRRSSGGNAYWPSTLSAASLNLDGASLYKSDSNDAEGSSTLLSHLQHLQAQKQHRFHTGAIPVLDAVAARFRLAKHRFQVIFALYVLTLLERAIVNVVVLLLLGLLVLALAMGGARVSEQSGWLLWVWRRELMRP